MFTRDFVTRENHCQISCIILNAIVAVMMSYSVAQNLLSNNVAWITALYDIRPSQFQSYKDKYVSIAIVNISCAFQSNTLKHPYFNKLFAIGVIKHPLTAKFNSFIIIYGLIKLGVWWLCNSKYIIVSIHHAY